MKRFTIFLLCSLCSYSIFANTLLIRKISGDDNAEQGQPFVQTYAVTQSNAYDLTKIHSIAVTSSPSEAFSVTQDSSSPCQSEAPVTLGSGYQSECRFQVNVTPRQSGSLAYTINVQGTELSSGGEANFGSLTENAEVQPPVAKPLELQFTGTNPVITNVGSTTELPFTLRNTSNHNIHIDSLSQSFVDSDFTVVPGSNCDGATLNTESKGECQFKVNYAPLTEESKSVSVAVKARDESGDDISSTNAQIQLQAKPINSILHLTYTGAMPIKEPVGVTKLLYFSLENTTSSNLQLGKIENNLTDSDLSVVSENNCDNTILNKEDKKSCQFMLRYTPSAAQTKKLSISILANDVDSNLIKSSTVDLDLQPLNNPPLVLNYEGEMPLHIVTADDPDTMKFILKSHDASLLKIKPLSFYAIEDNCSDKLLTNDQTCSFTVDAKSLDENKLVAQVSAEQVDAGGTMINSNEITIPVENQHVSISPKQVELEPSSREEYQGTNFTITNSTPFSMTIQVNGTDQRSKIGISSSQMWGNFQALYATFSPDKMCQSTNISDHAYTVPAKSNCQVQVRFTCTSNPARDVNSSPFFASIIDNCYMKNNPTDINYSQPLPGRDVKLNLTNMSTGKVLDEFSIKYDFSD